MKIVEYEDRFGEINFPEGFEESLKNLSLEEQMNRYRTTEHYSYSMTNWIERTKNYGYKKLEDTREVKSLIVKDGLLVGAMIVNDNGREVPCLPEERVCTYYAEDNNGAGYKTRIDYIYLVCVTDKFEE